MGVWAHASSVTVACTLGSLNARIVVGWEMMMYMMRRLLWEVTAKNFTINHNHNHNHKGGGGRGRSDTAVVKVSEQGPLGRGGDGDCHRVVGGEWQNDSFPAAAKEEEPAVMARSDGAGVEKGCRARQSPTSSEMPLRPNSRRGATPPGSRPPSRALLPPKQCCCQWTPSAQWWGGGRQQR